MALKPAARLPSAAWRKNRVSLLVILTPTPLELTLCGSYPPDSVMGQSWGFLRQALGVRSGFFDLFPKDENKETEVIAASVSSCLVLVSAALQCCHFLQFVRDSPIDEIVDSDAC